jgi:hypothetical protein
MLSRMTLTTVPLSEVMDRLQNFQMSTIRGDGQTAYKQIILRKKKLSVNHKGFWNNERKG